MSTSFEGIYAGADNLINGPRQKRDAKTADDIDATLGESGRQIIEYLELLSQREKGFALGPQFFEALPADKPEMVVTYLLQLSKDDLAALFIWQGRAAYKVFRGEQHEIQKADPDWVDKLTHAIVADVIRRRPYSPSGPALVNS